MKVPFVFRRLLKTKSLRIINLAGLILIFTSIIVSYAYISRETSFDTFHTKAGQIGRLSLSFEGKQPDGRIYTDSYYPVLKEIPEIEDILRLSVIETITLRSKNSKMLINNLVLTEKNFFDFFDISLLDDDPSNVFDAPGKIVISEKLALQLYGKTDVVGEQIRLEGRQYAAQDGIINGVFDDIPANSHFHTDIIVCEQDFDLMAYYYLLLKKETDTQKLSEKITTMIRDNFPEDNVKKTTTASILPLTDIHLRSNVLKEIEIGGKIDYIYIIVGANILLFIIVLFNLWLNSGIIFSYNKRYYQLLRLNGASTYDITKNEFQASAAISLISLLAALLLSGYIADYFGIALNRVPVTEKIILYLTLLSLSIFVSLLPILKSLSYTTFFNRKEDLKPVRFSFSSVKYMLVVQYTIVIFTIIVAIGINKQITIIRATQLGATNDSIVVLKEQPIEVIDKFNVLKAELQKHSEIESVAGAMQLPGEAIRDMNPVRVEGNDEVVVCPLLVVGNDFFSFFEIKPIAGNLPPTLNLSYEEEMKMMNDMYAAQSAGREYTTAIQDNLIINRKALTLLGFSSPEEAIGKEITTLHQSLKYIPSGKIYGVVDDFVYTHVYQDAIPMIIVQRNFFMNCFMIRLSPAQIAEALNILDTEWQKINPEYPLNYIFLKDYYRRIYHNEVNAEQLVRLFSALCLAITILGLIVFMAFIVKLRKKEIGIRKVNGASDNDIILMLNKNLIVSIVLSCIIAIPLSAYLMRIWLQNFAYKAELSLWLYASICLSVTLFSIIAVSRQVHKAAKVNPVDSIKSE